MRNANEIFSKFIDIAQSVRLPAWRYWFSRHHQQTDPEIARLQADMEELEYMCGKLLVEQHRSWINVRYKTIARQHLKNAQHTKKSEWIRLSNGLSRFFRQVPRYDSEIAIAMLEPYDVQYESRRISNGGTSRGNAATKEPLE